jgi:hypothetical protein
VTGRVVDNLERSERFLWDLRQTVQELIIENHAQHLKELAHRNSLGLSIEPYDMTPCADMNLGAVADVPMCEFWLYGFNTSFSVFEAASIAHTCGRPIVAAESFTSSDSEKWQAYPGTMKALGDWAFCCGVNRVVFHRYQHQPWLGPAPGMTMGPYGVHWERTQTWWDMVPAYHAYLSRCQFLLRQGQPFADVCFLVAEGAPQVFRPPPSATSGTPPNRLGYNFDGIAPDTFLARMSVKNGRLVLPDGLSYRLLVLPERDTMTPRLLRKVHELVQAGATVIGPRPVKSPGLSDYPECDAEVQKLAADLWGNCDGKRVKEHRFGKGRLVWERPTAGEPAESDQSRDALHRARWIWHNEGNPALEAPLGKRCFRRLFTLGASRRATSARLVLTADNSFQAWVNGHKVAEGDNFTELYTADVRRFLQPGTNLLAILAENAGDAPNPAGLIVSLTIRFADGPDMVVASDQQWQTALEGPAAWTSTPGSDEGWNGALELGPFGMAPWNQIGGAYKEPDQYGSFSTATKLLRQAGVPPDFECGKLSTLNSQPSTPIRYTHRHDRGFDLYFVANPEECEVMAECLFRVSGKQPELWNPLTGEMRELREFSFEQGRTRVPLHFEPHESWFIAFRRASSGPKSPSPNWEPPKRIADLSAGPWEVSFDPKWGGPAGVTFRRLEDWTARPEEGIQYYSGKAIYRKGFDLPGPVAGPKQGLCLDLGVVKNLARVRLNGRDLGVVWCDPWRVDISQTARPTENRLEIEVANLWPNRLIGDEQLPPDCEYAPGGNLARFPDWLLQGQPRPSSGRYTFTTWKHFTKDSPLLPSGLLGPVRLLVQPP